MKIEEIHNKLSILNPTVLDVIDESSHHIGHSGYNPNGISHIKIRISSPLFNGLTRVNQHKLIYNTLSEFIAQIHAVSIEII